MRTSACLVGALLAVGQVQAGVIDRDATIDYPTGPTRVIEGTNPNPPTVVEFLDGASITSMVLGYLDIYDSSVLNMRGGSVQDWLRIYDHSTVNLSGGVVGSETYVHDYGILNSSGGSSGVNLYAYDSSTINFSGGYVLVLLYATGSSTVDISGGNIEGLLIGHDSSELTVRGGAVSALQTYEFSEVDILGGLFPHSATLAAYDSSIVNIYGYDLVLTEYLGDHYDFTLTGTLADGNRVQMRVKWRDDAQIILHEVPEPGTAALGLTALLGLLACVLRERRR